MNIRITNYKETVEIDDNTYEAVMGLYPEEKWQEYFKIQNDAITLSDLQTKCHKLHIDWQWFLLNKEKLEHERERIEKNRFDKIPSESIHMTTRPSDANNDKLPSLRIMDRLIRAQTFTSSAITTSCSFNGKLKPLNEVKDLANYIFDYFEITTEQFQQNN